MGRWLATLTLQKLQGLLAEISDSNPALATEVKKLLEAQMAADRKNRKGYEEA